MTDSIPHSYGLPPPGVLTGVGIASPGRLHDAAWLEWSPKRRMDAIDLLLEVAVLLGARGPAETLALRLSGPGSLATSCLD